MKIQFFTEATAVITMAVAVAQVTPAPAAGMLNDVGLIED